MLNPDTIKTTLRIGPPGRVQEYRWHPMAWRYYPVVQGCGWVCDLPDIGPWTMRPYGDLMLVHSDCSGLWVIRAGKLERP